LSAKFDQDIYEWRMPLTCSQMQWCEPIWVGAVHNFKHLIVLIELLLCIYQDLVDFVSITLVDFCPIVHFHLFDILLSISLFLRFLRFLWHGGHCQILILRHRTLSCVILRLDILSCMILSRLVLSILVCITPTISSELISFFIIIIFFKVYLLSILHLWSNRWSLILCFFCFCWHWWVNVASARSFGRLLDLFFTRIISWLLLRLVWSSLILLEIPCW